MQDSVLEGGQELGDTQASLYSGSDAGSFKNIFSYFPGHLHFILQIL